MIDRFITTKMSARIVARLLRAGWTPQRIAAAIKAPVTFVHGVQAKEQVLTFDDIEVLARRTRQSPHLMLLDAIPSSDVNPRLRALFASTREVLETSASGPQTRKRRARTKAA